MKKPVKTGTRKIKRKRTYKGPLPQPSKRSRFEPTDLQNMPGRLLYAYEHGDPKGEARDWLDAHRMDDDGGTVL